MKMYTGLARESSAMVEFSDYDWEFVADTPWGNVLARGEGALLIVVDDEDKVDLEELALKISLSLMVERVAFPLEPPEIPTDYVPKGELEVKGVMVGEASDEDDEDDDGEDQGIISGVIMGRSADLLIIDDLEKPLKGPELFPPMKRDDEDGVQ